MGNPRPTKKVVCGSNVQVLTSHAGLKLRSPRSCTTLSLAASFVSGKSRLVTSAKRELSKVIPVTGDRGIVLVLRGEFGLAKKPRLPLVSSRSITHSFFCRYIKRHMSHLHMSFFLCLRTTYHTIPA